MKIALLLMLAGGVCGMSAEELGSCFELPDAGMREIARRIAEAMETKSYGVKMYDSFVDLEAIRDPDGSVLAIDFGGTNIRIDFKYVWAPSGGDEKMVDLLDYSMAVPEHVKNNTREVFGWLAEQVRRFLGSVREKVRGSRLPVGFTFSFPVDQTSISSGRLTCWGKEYRGDEAGTVGEDVVRLLQSEIDLLESRDETKLNLTLGVDVLVNDVISALFYGIKTVPDTRIAVVLGTGTNLGLVNRDNRLVNTEMGRFSDPRVFPSCKYDDLLDEQSSNPGDYMYEKRVSGLYLGELFRLALVDLVQRGGVLSGAALADCTAHSIPTEEMVQIKNGVNVTGWLEARFGVGLVDEGDLAAVVELASAVFRRSVRITAAGVAAGIVHSGLGTFGEPLTRRAMIGVDGSLFLCNPEYGMMLAEHMAVFFPGTKDGMVVISGMRDSSRLGAVFLTASVGQSRG